MSSCFRNIAESHLIKSDHTLYFDIHSQVTSEEHFKFCSMDENSSFSSLASVAFAISINDLSAK